MEFEAKREEYAEVFGLTPEECGPAPETETDGTGGEPSETAPESAQEPREDEGGDVTPETVEGPAEEPKPAAMSPEERHRQAAARRAREQQAAQERQMQEQQSRDRLVAEMFKGQVNPYTGKPVTTEAEYRAYVAEKSRQEAAQQLQRAGITPDTIHGIVEQQLAPMKGQLLQAQMQAAQERARTVNMRAQEAIGAAIRNISADMPEIKSLEDIAALPTGQEFNRYVQMGLPVEKAFYLANQKEIEGRKIAAAKAAALHGVAGKQHLNPVPSGGGSEPVEVPADMRAAYREMMPDASDAEIRSAYAKYLKDVKK